MSVDKGYPSRQGIEYEINTLAYFALTLYNNALVENFTLRSNAPQRDFGKFDDIVAVITMRNGEKRYFAIQTKHTENETKPFNFFKKDGSFKHAIVFDSVKCLDDTRECVKEKFNFLFYTNQKGNFNSSSVFHQVVRGTCNEDEFFLTNNDFSKTCKVPNTNFYIYTDQNNKEQIKRKIIEIFQNLHLSENLALTYIDFVRKLHENQFLDRSLDKETLNLHLVDLLLIPDVIPNSFDFSVDEIVAHACNLGPNVETGNNAIIGTQCLLLLLEIYTSKYQIQINDSSSIKELLENCCYVLGQKFKFIEKESSLNLPPESGKTKILFYFFQAYLCELWKKHKIQAIHTVDDLNSTQHDRYRLFIANPTLNQSLRCFMETKAEIVSSISSNFPGSEIMNLIQSAPSGHFNEDSYQGISQPQTMEIDFPEIGIWN